MTLHIETAGDGPDLVLLHGWGMHGGVWAGMRDLLAAHFRVHVIDLPGMGWSAPVAPYTLPALSAHIAAGVPAGSTVIGWSLGGQVAMRIALDQPSRIARLVLVGATPRFVNGDGWEAGMAAEVFIQFAAQVGADYQETLSRFLGLQAFGGEAPRTLLRELRERFFERPAPDGEVLQQALRILLETDLRAELPLLQTPTLVIHGNRDTLAPCAAGKWLASHLPRAQLKLIPGASHAPFLSHPDTFVSAVTAFVQSQADALREAEG